MHNFVSEHNTIVAEPQEVITDPQDVITEPQEVITEPPRFVTKPEKFVTKPKKVITEPEKVITKTKKFVTEPEKLVTKPKKVTNEPKQITTQPRLATEEPWHLINVTEESKESKLDSTYCKFFSCLLLMTAPNPIKTKFDCANKSYLLNSGNLLVVCSLEKKKQRKCAKYLICFESKLNPLSCPAFS